MKHPKYDGLVVAAMCGNERRHFGITAIRQGRDYVFTWAFRLSEGSLKREGFDKNKVKGNVIMSEKFPGCPYCGRKNWVQCGACGKFVCAADDIKYFKCPACGNEGEVSLSESFDLSGSGI